MRRKNYEMLRKYAQEVSNAEDAFTKAVLNESKDEIYEAEEALNATVEILLVAVNDVLADEIDNLQ